MAIFAVDRATAVPQPRSGTLRAAEVLPSVMAIGFFICASSLIELGGRDFAVGHGISAV